MKHPEDCQCHLHIATDCPYCEWTGIGTTRRGTHIKKEHPDKFVGRVTSASRLAAKVLQAHYVAQEMKRLSDKGIRFLPSKHLDYQVKQNIQAWMGQLKRSQDVRHNLLVEGLDKAERGVQSIRDFKRLQTAIVQSSKLSPDGSVGLYKRHTHYNTSVAGEILKLSFALNKTWSFAVHLLLLYGLEAMAEQIATTGVLPPTEIQSPTRELAKAERNQ
jgi:hypothetical protein